MRFLWAGRALKQNCGVGPKFINYLATGAAGRTGHAFGIGYCNSNYFQLRS